MDRVKQPKDAFDHEYGIHGVIDGDIHSFSIESKYKMSTIELRDVLLQILSQPRDSYTEIYDWKPIRRTKGESGCL